MDEEKLKSILRRLNGRLYKVEFKTIRLIGDEAGELDEDIESL